MFAINEDLSIHVTRGDILFFKVTADDKGEAHKFQPGDVVRMTVFEKKACNCVVLQKDFPVVEETEFVDIFLNEEETRFCDLISKPTTYWYEIELNPLTKPQTIVGYDENGAKVFKLFPEGDRLEVPEPDIEPEDIPIIDGELDLLSPRPVENRVVTAAIVRIDEYTKRMGDYVTEITENNKKDIRDHDNDKSNPHDVSAAQVGLGNVPNVATNDQTPTYEQAEAISELSSGEKLSAAFGKLKKAVSDLISHLGNKNNPHSVTAAQAGARPDTWFPDASEVGAAPVSHVGDTNNPHCVTAAQAGARPDTWIPTPEEVGAAEAGAFDGHVNDNNNPHAVTAEQVGARADTWLPTAEEVGAAEAGAFAEHIDNKSNPHEVTAEQVGARPDTWMPTAADVGACVITKLWMNEDPKASFAATTITIPELAEYTHIGVVVNWVGSANVLQLSNMQVFELSSISGDDRGIVSMTMVVSDVQAGSRKVGYDGTTGVVIDSARFNDKENNMALVPYAIYGIKGVIA